jgi:thiamine monophosphate synthase
VDALREVKKHIGIPVFGLGGIGPDNIQEVMRAGADGVAMISAIFAAGDIKRASTSIIGRIGESLEQ